LKIPNCTHSSSNTNKEANLSASLAAIQSNPRALTKKAPLKIPKNRKIKNTRWQIFSGQTIPSFLVSYLPRNIVPQ